MSIIVCKNLSKTFKVAERSKGVWKAFLSLFKRKYKTVNALKDINFEIEEGSIVGYIGPNGAGKSTTIKIMSGILTPTSGKCIIDGKIPYKDRVSYVKNIGVVFGQKSQLWWDVPVIDSFELLKDIYKIPYDQYETTLSLLTEKLNLQDTLNKPLRQLSLGQKMKCELAASLLHRPKILFLDEPTIGLDAVTKLAVRDFVKKINKEWHTTVILTTHDMNDIEALTDKIILIGHGEILYNGSFNNIKKKYCNEKYITVEFSKTYQNVEFDNYELISYKNNIAKYKFVGEKFSSSNFLKEFTKTYEIEDFSVESLNVEEILAKLYKDYQL